jgi:hypothetical protein
MGNIRTIRGRKITDDDILFIRETIEKYFNKGRKYISRQICYEWKWYQPNGQLKDMACRYILLFLEKENLIKLPPRLTFAYNEKKKTKKIELDKTVLVGTVKNHFSLNLRLLAGAEEYKLWNRIVHTYHYQGHQIIVGKYLKYIVYINGVPVACLGRGSPAWSLNLREKWVGWDKKTKDKNLGGIVNNIRFLILPRVKIKYLASHLLALSARRIAHDWFERYGERVYLPETFVEKERFKGTCYKAANWAHLGQTKGSSKRGSSHYHHGNIKDIYVYPLCKDFRSRLIGKPALSRVKGA